eukprot:s679_g2.t1
MQNFDLFRSLAMPCIYVIRLSLSFLDVQSLTNGQLRAEEEQIFRPIEKLWTGPGTHIGMLSDYHPPFERGTVVGIDVDMDDGSLAFWANGEFLGIVKDNEDKPVNLKGKKIVPALSVFGRNTGKHKENTVMEVRTGLDAPTRPGK